MKHNNKLALAGVAGAIGMLTLSFAMAAVPDRFPLSHVTDDTAIYQKLSDINAQKEPNPNFDMDIRRLSEQEKNYKEQLPSLASLPQLRGPMGRIAKQGYRHSGASVRGTGVNAKK
ncbi:hypothetical protein WDW86_04355 [Bdellovibrionota bacterium FG-2]